jgi:hypothetical protein
MCYLADLNDNIPSIITFFFLISFPFFLFLSPLSSYISSFCLFIYRVSYFQSLFPAFTLRLSPITKQSFQWPRVTIRRSKPRSQNFLSYIPYNFPRSAYFYYEDGATCLLRNIGTCLLDKGLSQPRTQLSLYLWP